MNVGTFGPAYTFAMSGSARRSPRRSSDLPLRVAERLLAAAHPEADAWSSLCSETVVLRIANRPVAVGREKARAELTWLFAPVIEIGQGFRAAWPGVDGATVLMELDMTIASCSQALPLAIVLRALEPAPVIRDIRFYLDPAPLKRRANNLTQ